MAPKVNLRRKNSSKVNPLSIFFGGAKTRWGAAAGPKLRLDPPHFFFRVFGIGAETRGGAGWERRGAALRGVFRGGVCNELREMDPTRPRTSGPKAGTTPSKGDVERPSAGVAAGQGEEDAQTRYRLALLQGQKMKRDTAAGAQGRSGASGGRKPSPSRGASASPRKSAPPPAAAHPSAHTPSTGLSSASSHASPPKAARSTGNPRAATAAAPSRGASGGASPPPHHVAAASASLGTAAHFGRGQRTQGSPEKARPMSARTTLEVTQGKS